MRYGAKTVLLAIFLCAAAEPASAAAAVFEGFSGSFLRAFIAYAILFISAHLASFLLMRLGFIQEKREEDVTVSHTDNG